MAVSSPQLVQLAMIFLVLLLVVCLPFLLLLCGYNESMIWSLPLWLQCGCGARQCKVLSTFPLEARLSMFWSAPHVHTPEHPMEPEVIPVQICEESTTWQTKTANSLTQASPLHAFDSLLLPINLQGMISHITSQMDFFPVSGGYSDSQQSYW